MAAPIDQDLDKLKHFVGDELDSLAKKTHLSIKELMEIIEEVNIVKLHAEAHHAMRKISHAVDLTPSQIYEIFTHHREAPLEDLCQRLLDKSVENRSKF